MFDFFCGEAAGFPAVDEQINREAPNQREGERTKWFINNLSSKYKTRLHSTAWYADFQKISTHHKVALVRNLRDKDNIKNIFTSILHPAPNSSFIIPDETIKMLEALMLKNINIRQYPKYFLFLEFKFTLAKPYISKDDTEFYIEENPIHKDKVFKVPMVAPSTWKGNMRYAVRQVLEIDVDDDQRTIDLFGNPRKSESDFKMGRLIFYPTFFNKIGLEVFNPHIRKTRAGTHPIFFESVPAGTTGTFQLFYAPYDLIGRDCKNEIVQDLDIIYQGVKRMFLTFGFSAKKSLDYGIAEKDVTNGTFEMAHVPLFKDVPATRQMSNQSGPFAKLASLRINGQPERVEDKNFPNFDELGSLVDRIKGEVMKNA